MFPPRHVLAAAGLVAVLAACSPAAPPAAGVPAESAAVAMPAPAITDEAGLRAAAAAALAEQRIYAPAGDNAIEHYLALRGLHADDATLATALLELLPYALIASEQAVVREDFPEARRLLALIERVDPQAPSLARLRDGIAAAEAESARRLVAQAEEAKREEQEAAQAAAAEAEARRVREAAAAVATPPPASTPPMAPPAPSPAPVPVPPPQQPAASAAAAATAATTATPRLLSAPPPRYPLVALRRKIEGSVTVAFVIQPDGSVGSPRVVSADPPGVFEDAALVAAERWRFEPTPAAVASARVVQFRLGEAAP